MRLWLHREERANRLAKGWLLGFSEPGSCSCSSRQATLEDARARPRGAAIGRLYQLVLVWGGVTGEHVCHCVRSRRFGSTETVRIMAGAQRSLAARLKDDVTCLKSMWFAKGGGETHAERLDNFYKPQAQECALPCDTPSLPVSRLGARA